MENFLITKNEKGLHIEGLPDAIKVVCIDNPEARRVADMALHRYDLSFTLECLEAINISPDKPSVIRQALWHSAIVHYLKCFQGSCARILLAESKVYNSKAALDAFNYFKNLRNKHIIHDENSYAQSLPSAAINDGKKAFKIEKILCMTVIAETLEQANYTNLHSLTTEALKYVEAQSDELCNRLTITLEKESYDDLNNRPSLTVKAPEIKDISKQR